MKPFALKTIRSIPVISLFCLCLSAAGAQWLGLLESSSAALLLAHSDRDDRDRGDRYYDQGFQFGRQDARRNLSQDYRRHRREFNSRWESDFRQGYEDGYEDRFDRNERDRGRGRGRWGDDDRSRGDYGNRGYVGPGTLTWRGRVDDYVELRIQGNRVYSKERRGAPTLSERYNFSNPLPRAEVRVFVKKRDGRGRVQLLEQPNRSNGYTAAITVDDDKGGADDYEIEVRWE